MKNNKIKIETGSEKLTPEEINAHKDFNKVYKTFTTTKTNTVKTPKKFGGLTTMVVVTTTVLVTTIGVYKYWSSHKTMVQPKVTTSAANSNKTSSAGANTTKAETQHPYINPPLKGVNVPYKTYSVDAEKGGTIAYKNSKVVIPAASFCDENGKDITGKVDIKYREFHNAADFFASGIPMTYDSAGKQYTFESAGMLDIQGYQDGKKVYIKNGKDLHISMVTTRRREVSYNVYELDTIKQNWTYITKSTCKPLPVAATAKKDTIAAPERQEARQIQTTIAGIKQDEAKLEKTKPVEPKKAVTGKNTFNIDADASEFPELSIYKNLLWEPDSADKNYKPSYSAVIWEDASLKRNPDGTTYNFTVKKGNESHCFIVHPVFAGKDYETAMKEYDKKYQDYQVAYNKRKAEEKKQQDAYDAMMARIKQEQEKQEKSMIAANVAYAAENYFTINSFGIYNSDCPGNMPKGAELRPQYTDNSKDDLNGNDFFMIEKDKNIIYVIHPGHNCKFNPNKENFAWMVTPGNHLAIYTVEDFGNINKTSGDFIFTMKVMDKKISSMDDLKEVFMPYVGDLDAKWGGRRAML
ncbi:MAG: hypothetical protein ACLQQ4_06115 [Bacteroidia bacterium]